MAKEGHYENVITQNNPGGKAPSPKLFSQWVLDEINKDSAMRDQIGDEIAEIQDNGRNASRLISYRTSDGLYRGCLGFEPADLAIRCKGGKDHVYHYEVVLRAVDAHHGGVTFKTFKYTFKARSEYFPGTKAYQIRVVSYPLYTGKTETEDPQ